MKNNELQVGKQYWRSLEQRANSPEFRKWVENEFPASASQMDNAWSRRHFLTLMGASMALAGLAGCRRPAEKIIPFVKPPAEITPGLPLFYATTMPVGNSAYGLVVESHEGRPTKIEGNEQSPSTRGKSNLQMQAAILDLYDPDRSQAVIHGGRDATWDGFMTAWSDILEQASGTGGAGVAFLSEPFSSPTLARLKREIEQKLPEADWVAWEPISDENGYRGTDIATGKRLQPVYHYNEAEVILSLDSDFLLTESESLTAAGGFAAGRGVETEHDSMNRLYITESLFSVTGASADHRLAMTADAIADFARALAVDLRRQGLSIDDGITASANKLSSEQQNWIRPLAADLIRSRSKSLITVGHRQPAAVHALAICLNQALGNIGNTVTYVEPVDAVFSSNDELRNLTKRMASGAVSTLVIIGGNPVYNAPVDIGFKDALKKVTTSVHLSSHVDETSAETTWHIPRAHFLESWGDARSVDGTVGIIQPLIEPLFSGKSDIGLFSALVSEKSDKDYDVVRQTWQREWGTNFDNNWKQALHDGVIASTSSEVKSPLIDTARVAKAIDAVKKVSSSDELTLVFHTDNCLADGSSANNGWLQELPDPITKLSWDNVATVSPATAGKLRVKNEDIVQLKSNGRSLSLPIWIVPGQADNVVGLALGYGRTKAGRVGNSCGFDSYSLRTSEALHFDSGVTLTPAGKSYELANTQDHGTMDGRPLVREATLTEYKEHPEFAAEAVEHPPLKSLWYDREYDSGYQWGMAIDLSKCNGCGICTIACQSENNIPVVGKEETRRGREMNWMRIDRYFVGDVNKPQMVHQPVACQHCENAPCEQVCPVAATVHDEEGLNAMVYNRCVGTRYCANNCPYKVRRFNFFNYTKDTPEVVKMAQNPEVTVRSRGVMEKCSYCLQRITTGKRLAKLEDRELRDGEIKAACQQGCPSDAIVFGNIRDPKSRVAQIKKRNRNYDLLAELNIKPRTSYLARLRNPNTEMPS